MEPPPVEDTRGPSSQGITLIIICGVFLAPAVAAVGLRIWARRIQRVELCFNDYAILLALFFEVALTITLVVAVVVGKVGYHVWSLTSEELVSLGKAYVAAEPLWISTNSCVKLSILHLYLTIFRIQKFRWAVYGVAALVIVYWASTITRMFFLCSPFAYSWDKGISGGTCIDLEAAYLSVSIINLILDVMVIVLPMPVLWRLQMATSKKIAITAIFSIGAVICIITIFRIVSVVRLDLIDISYSVVNDGIFSQLEPCLGIVNASLPVLHPAFSKIFSGSKAFAWTRSPTSKSSSGGPRTTKGTRRCGWWLSPSTSSSSKVPVLQPTADVNHFQKLTGEGQCVSVIGTRSQAEASFDQRTGSDVGLEMWDDLEMNGNIRVTTQWNVRTGTEHSI